MFHPNNKQYCGFHPLGQTLQEMASRFFIGTPPPPPSTYYIIHVTKSPRPSPSIFHTSSDQNSPCHNHTVSRLYISCILLYVLPPDYAALPI